MFWKSLNIRGLGGKRGFTLIELSIVIVLIGLIVAGVVGGQVLVQQAKLRSQISEFQKYSVAFNSFRLEYGEMPGDFSMASSYWGGVTDGNGNRRIDGNSYGANHPNIETEMKTFFWHLSSAGLIPESFNGTWNANSNVGVSFPALKIDPKKGMVASGATNTNGQAQTTSATRQVYKAALALIVGQPNSTNSAFNDIIGTGKPRTYSSIDNKIDDGVARSGIFTAERPWNGSTGNGDCLDGNDGDYLLTNTLAACHALYILSK